LSRRLAHCQARSGAVVACLRLAEETARLRLVLSLALAKKAAARALVLLSLCVAATKESSARLLLLLWLGRALAKETTRSRLLLGCTKQASTLLLLRLS